jgi:hypothetical protein
MKMGTIASPFAYDAAAGDALQSASLRPGAILHYARHAAVFQMLELFSVDQACSRFGNMLG